MTIDGYENPELDEIYYNTTRYTGDDLRLRVARAYNQDQAILLWMTSHPEADFTRDELHVRVLPNAQNTSIGRSLNSLMRAGYVSKLPEYRMGRFGSRQHLWQVTRRPSRDPEQRSLL